MTEQMTLTVKESALQAIKQAKEQLHIGQYGTYTKDQVYQLAAEISGLAPHMLKWAQDDR
jgi:hypothetical protein